MKFPERLIYLRKARGLSQEELGNEIGVSRQTISKWELSQSLPDTHSLIALSEYLNISIDDLVKEDNTVNQESKYSTINTAEPSDSSKKLDVLLMTVLNGLGIFGVVGVLFFLLIGIIFR